MTTRIRRATSADADALVALRITMFEAMGTPAARDGVWNSNAAAWFREHLADGSAAAFVAEAADGRLAAAAVGQLSGNVPSPSNPGGVRGYVSNVVTVPEHRRNGHARACVEGLVAWFRDETEVAAVDLFASDDGQGLYEELGFRTRPYPAMRLTLHADH